jgi:hypothetical protein
MRVPTKYRAVPVHASLTEEHLVGLNSDQGSMVMGISEYLKGKSGKPFFLVQGGAGTGKSFSTTETKIVTTMIKQAL